MIREKRINEILKRLKNYEEIDIKILSKKFNVSERTILRDLKEKIPFLIDIKILKENGKYFLEKNFDSENIILNFLIAESKNYGKKFHEDILKFIQNIKDIKKINDLYKKSDNENIDDIMDQINFILKAIENENCLTCFYNNKKRIFIPLKIVNFEGFWYLILKDLEKRIITKYHLKSMSYLKIIENRKYIKPCNSNILNKIENGINAFFDINADFFPVHLHIEKEVSKYFIRKPLSKNQRILKIYNDNSIDIEIYITNDMEILPTIQKYIPYIKIIYPLNLIEKLKKNIENLNLY